MGKTGDGGGGSVNVSPGALPGGVVGAAGGRDPFAAYPVEIASFVLAWPPSVNSYWRRATFGRVPVTHLSHAARAFRVKAIEAMWSQGVARGHVDERVAVIVRAYPPDRRARDVDNILKPLLDVMIHAGVLMDDRFVKLLMVEEIAIEKPGRVEVVVRGIGKERTRCS